MWQFETPGEADLLWRFETPGEALWQFETHGVADAIVVAETPGVAVSVVEAILFDLEQLEDIQIEICSQVAVNIQKGFV